MMLRSARLGTALRVHLRRVRHERAHPRLGVEIASLVRLVEARAKQEGFTNEDGVALDALHEELAQLPHWMRVWRLARLGERTDGLHRCPVWPVRRP